jgi:hypothetical protein
VIRCEECGQRFGGQVVFDRHRSRRLDRCLSAVELRLRGLHRDRRRVWHQPRPDGQKRLPGIARAGSRTIEDRIAASGAGEPVSERESETPKQTRAREEASA